LVLSYNVNYIIKHCWSSESFDEIEMNSAMNTSRRKSEHIQIVLNENVNSIMTSGLEKYQFEHNALPEIDLKDVSLNTTFFGHELKSPLLISSMTGGNVETGRINQTLAKVAQQAGIALAVGSQRAGLENPENMASFKVREFAPDILLFSNIGAVQLNYAYSVAECQRAVETIQADALFLHLNPLQEALQPEGNTDFSGLLKKIAAVCKKLTVPVVVKEVGWGISAEVARWLASAGVTAIDVAGAGGTSWSQVEKFRISDEIRRKVAEGFVDWGLPTAESILAVKAAVPEMTIIASGGLRSGLDVAKSVALGASLAGLAGRFIKAAVESEEKTIDLVEEINLQLKICMFSTGVDNIEKLKKTPLRKI
jgi:isopentenyl-diphosphate delta-isomerase